MILGNSRDWLPLSDPMQIQLTEKNQKIFGDDQTVCNSCLAQEGDTKFLNMSLIPTATATDPHRASSPTIFEPKLQTHKLS